MSIVIIYTENCHPSYLVSNETTPKRSPDSQTRLKYGNMDSWVWFLWLLLLIMKFYNFLHTFYFATTRTEIPDVWVIDSTARGAVGYKNSIILHEERKWPPMITLVSPVGSVTQRHEKDYCDRSCIFTSAFYFLPESSELWGT